MIQILYNIYIDKLKKGESFCPMLYIKKEDKIIMNFIPYKKEEEKVLYRNSLYEKAQKENITQCCAVILSQAYNILSKQKLLSFLIIECNKDGNNKCIVQYYEYNNENKVILTNMISTDKFDSYWNIFKKPETLHDCET